MLTTYLLTLFLFNSAGISCVLVLVLLLTVHLSLFVLSSSEPSTEPPPTKASSKQSSAKPASAQTLLVTAVTPLSIQQRSGIGNLQYVAKIYISR